MEVKIGLSGFGNVGRAFTRLLEEKESLLTEKYGLRMRLVLAANSRGAVQDIKGLNMNLLKQLSQSKELSQMPGFQPGLTGPEAVAVSGADVWVEASAGCENTGYQPGVSYFKGALSKGIHVVTLNKGPLVAAYDELMALAKKAGVQIKFSGATAAALPTIDVAVNSLAGSRITSIEGILNGTSNFILTCMEEEGVDFSEALEEARKRGIAEPDPSLDVEGWDTAYKILIIAKTVFGRAFRLEDMEVEGIAGITSLDLKKAKESGGTIKLVGFAEDRGGEFILNTGPKILPREHPLAGVRGTTKGIHFCSDTMGPLTVIGGYSNPRGAAAAALKDIISLYFR